ncbi:unnamed protein product [Caretta caretta]
MVTTYMLYPRDLYILIKAKCPDLSWAKIPTEGHRKGVWASVKFESENDITRACTEFKEAVQEDLGNGAGSWGLSMGCEQGKHKPEAQYCEGKWEMYSSNAGIADPKKMDQGFLKMLKEGFNSHLQTALNLGVNPSSDYESICMWASECEARQGKEIKSKSTHIAVVRAKDNVNCYNCGCLGHTQKNGRRKAQESGQGQNQGQLNLCSTSLPFQSGPGPILPLPPPHSVLYVGKLDIGQLDAQAE